MRQRLIRFLIFLGMLFLFTGCDKLNFLNPSSGEPKTTSTSIARGTVIAEVNNTPIILEDLNKEIDSYNAAMTEADRPELKITTRDQKIDYLKNEMVRQILLYQKAIKEGLDKKDEVLKVLEKTRQQLSVIELVRKETEGIGAASAEIEDAYNTYKEQFKEPEERRIREIVVPTETEANSILIQLLQGTDFATLAKERSKSASSKSGGDLGFIKKGTKFPQFDAMAFADTLEAGKTSSIFKGPDGYYIVMVEEKRGGRQKSLSDMWEGIKRDLTFLKKQQKIKDLVDRLSRESKIKYYEGEIN